METSSGIAIGIGIGIETAHDLTAMERPGVDSDSDTDTDGLGCYWLRKGLRRRARPSPLAAATGEQTVLTAA